MPAPHELAERRVAERPVEEVGPQREDHARTAECGSAASAVRPVEEAAARLLVDRQREQLLELVDDQQQLAAGREDCFTTRRIPSSSRASSSTRSSGRSTATRSSAAASSSKGYEPGNMSVTNQRSEPGERAAAEGRQQPGPDDRRLADPGRADDRDQAPVADRRAPARRRARRGR